MDLKIIDDYFEKKYKFEEAERVYKKALGEELLTEAEEVCESYYKGEIDDEDLNEKEIYFRIVGIFCGIEDKLYSLGYISTTEMPDIDEVEEKYYEYYE